MTNLDKIRDMSAEEFAEKILNVDSLCRFCDLRGTTECDNYADCLQGKIDWLNQELDSFSDLEVGDIIYSYYPEIGKKVCYVYLDGNIMWCCTDNVFVKLEEGMKKFIKSIYRKARYSFDKEEIWRAE